MIEFRGELRRRFATQLGDSYLHETFKEPVRTVRDRQSSFEVRTIVWGEFNAAAAVRFKDGREEKPERYLNL